MSGETSARFDQEVKSGLSSTTEGTCDGYLFASRLVSVNIGGVAIPMPWFGPAPWKGDTVRVLKIGDTRICHSVYGSAQGTVASISAGVATVNGDDGVSYSYPVRVGDTISAGHRVRLDHAGRLVLGRYAVEPPGSDYVTPAGPPVTAGGRQTFRPVDSGNYRYGSFAGQDVQVNEGRSGAYWYGTQIADTIPDGAVVTRAEITLTELFDYLPGIPSQLGTHTQATRGGEPTISGTINISGGGTFSILPYANALKTGAAFGVGFRIDTGYRAFGAYDTSGSIHMEWS